MFIGSHCTLFKVSCLLVLTVLYLECHVYWLSLCCIWSTMFIGSHCTVSRVPCLLVLTVLYLEYRVYWFLLYCIYSTMFIGSHCTVPGVLCLLVLTVLYLEYHVYWFSLCCIWGTMFIGSHCAVSGVRTLNWKIVLVKADGFQLQVFMWITQGLVSCNYMFCFSLIPTPCSNPVDQLYLLNSRLRVRIWVWYSIYIQILGVMIPLVFVINVLEPTTAIYAN